MRHAAPPPLCRYYLNNWIGNRSRSVSDCPSTWNDFCTLFHLAYRFPFSWQLSIAKEGVFLSSPRFLFKLYFSFLFTKKNSNGSSWFLLLEMKWNNCLGIILCNFRWSSCGKFISSLRAKHSCFRIQDKQLSSISLNSNGLQFFGIHLHLRSGKQSVAETISS